MDTAQSAAAKALEGWKFSRQILETTVAHLRAKKGALQSGFYSMRTGIKSLGNEAALAVFRAGEGAVQSGLIGVGIAADGVERAMYSMDVLLDDLEAALKPPVPPADAAKPSASVEMVDEAGASNIRGIDNRTQ